MPHTNETILASLLGDGERFQYDQVGEGLCAETQIESPSPSVKFNLTLEILLPACGQFGDPAGVVRVRLARRVATGS